MEMVVGIKVAYLVSLSTMARMLSNPDDEGNSRIKSIDIISKG
jgi:hypothetical protein